MSKDIRSFFTVLSKKSTSTVSAGKSKSTVSSDEDVIEGTPDVPKKKQAKKRRIHVLSSDSEPDSPKNISKNKGRTPKGKDSKQESKHVDHKPKLKPVNIADVFNKTPIKQTKVELPPEPKEKEVPNAEKIKDSKGKKKHKKSKTELGIHGDADFEKTLIDLDDDSLFESNIDIFDKTIDDALSKEASNNGEGSSYVISESSEKEDVNKKEQDKGADSNSSKIENGESSSRKPDKKRLMDDESNAYETPNKKKKLEHTDSGIDPDQELYEKKRYSAMLYQKYLNRSGPKHHGMKEIPKGKPDCLKNLCFLRTGVLDSLDNEEFVNLVKDHGGRVVNAVSRKVNYIVVGEEPGPAKLAKAESYKISSMTEDELFNMIREKSGIKIENTDTLSEDTGVDLDTESNKDSQDSDFINSVFDKKHTEETISKTKKEEKEHTRKSSSPSETKRKEKEKKVSRHKDRPADKPDLKKLSNIKTNKFYSHSEKAKSEDVSSLDLPKVEKSPKKEKISNEPSVASKDVTSEPNKPVEKQKITVDKSAMSWADKYKPKDTKAIIGQQANTSSLNKLKKWLQNWYSNRDPNKKLVKPSPWDKTHDGAYFKCVLLSGSPGVGKTTTATLVANELGFDVVEFNASDTRSKRLLHEEVMQLLRTQTIAGFATGSKHTSKKRVLIMDEVDGMAGNEDRGGIQEMINLIKTTNVPIICMCNDRNHQKIRSLCNYCYDLNISKPRVEQIRGAMMSVCFKEGINITPQALTEIISGTGCDIRQTLNNLSMWSASSKNLSMETAQKEAKAAKKDTVLGPWEVVRTTFNESDQKKMTLADKMRLFFFDYSLGPLFIHENYLRVRPHFSTYINKEEINKEILKQIAKAADALSMGDIIDSKIRKSNNWSLLETQAVFSSVLPGFYMCGHLEGPVNFPGWLGKNSKRSKHDRILSEIQIHTRTSAQASKLGIKLDYLTPLRNAILTPLKEYGMNGIEKAVSVMKAYNLLREDVDNLMELTKWSGQRNPYANLDSKVKAAFTRAYNKKVPLLPYAPNAGVSKKKVASPDVLEEEEEELAESDSEQKDDVASDAMIKIKTKTTTSKKKSSESSTSKKAGKETKTVKKPDDKKGKGKKGK